MNRAKASVISGAFVMGEKVKMGCDNVEKSEVNR